MRLHCSYAKPRTKVIRLSKQDSQSCPKLKCLISIALVPCELPDTCHNSTNKCIISEKYCLSKYGVIIQTKSMTCLPCSGSSAKTTSPRASAAYRVIPTLASAPSLSTHLDQRTLEKFNFRQHECLKSPTRAAQCKALLQHCSLRRSI